MIYLNLLRSKRIVIRISNLSKKMIVILGYFVGVPACCAKQSVRFALRFASVLRTPASQVAPRPSRKLKAKNPQ